MKHPNVLDSNPHKLPALTMASWARLCHVDRELTAWCQAHTPAGFYLPFTVSWKQSQWFTSAHKAPDTPCAPASPTGKKMRCFLVNLPPDSCASLLLPHTGGQASTVSSWTVISILRLTECLQHCRNAQQKCNDYSYLIGKTAHISLLEIIFSGDPFKT